jgi:hypothetical protein
VRYKVVFKSGSGYASFDESQKDKAFELYREEGERILLQKDIFDEGTVIEQTRIEVVDLTRNYNAN